MTISSPKTAVVIPVHNGVDFTRRCLEALAHQTPADFDVVLVDDGSTDGTADCVRMEEPNVTVLRGDGSLWWSGAVNVGCRFAIAQGADIVVLFNNDNVECAPDVVSHIASLARSSGDCVSAVALADGADGSRCILHAGGVLDWKGRGQRLRESGTAFVSRGGVDECDWLPGTALAVPSELFEQLGGFDARRFPQYRGDIDFTLRAREAGRRCLVARDVWVVNDKAQSGLRFDHALTVREIANGLVSLRSPYNLREAVGFARRHCARRMLPRYLGLYYSRYLYACLKTRHPNVERVGRRLFGPSGATHTTW